MRICPHDRWMLHTLFPMPVYFLAVSRWTIVVATIFVAACSTQPAERAPEVHEAPAQISWATTVIETVPILTCDAPERWPMILWEGPGFNPLPAATLESLLARGIVPHVRLDPAMIAAAKAIQDAGGPVILMEGESSTWGYGWPEQLVPADISAWRKSADAIRSIMVAFRDAGVTVDAVWLDYEVAPLNTRFDDVRHDPAARQHIPDKALESPQAFAFWKRQLWTSLMSAYVAAPIREIFPATSVTNWMTVISTRSNPVPGMISGLLPPTDVGLFTATNPVAYGTDAGFWQNGGTTTMDRDHVDRRYMALLLGQITADAENRRDHAPHVQSFPWVGRWIPLSQQAPSKAGGLGVQVEKAAEGLRILSVHSGGPAERAHLFAGDIIIKAGDQALADFTLQQAIQTIRGKPGEDLQLDLRRNGTALSATVTRGRLDGGRAPVISRERYREALRHMWLRGIDGMQVFNSATPGHADLAIAEVIDAQAVYGEMLTVQRFMENGEPMNLSTYTPDQPTLWSGLRLGDEAVVRTASIGGWADTITVSPWPGTSITLPTGTTGKTWLLRRDSKTGLVEKTIAPKVCG